METCRCDCQIRVQAGDNVSVSYNVTNVTHELEADDDLFALHASHGRHHCVGQRHACKRTCAKHLDLTAHLQHFTPLGLVLCTHSHSRTPPSGLYVYAQASVTSEACTRHRGTMTSRLRQVRGKQRLCCDWTTLLDENGDALSRFGWNPDCQQQIFYLE